MREEREERTREVRERREKTKNRETYQGPPLSPRCLRLRQIDQATPHCPPSLSPDTVEIIVALEVRCCYINQI